MYVTIWRNCTCRSRHSLPPPSRDKFLVIMWARPIVGRCNRYASRGDIAGSLCDAGVGRLPQIAVSLIRQKSNPTAAQAKLLVGVALLFPCTISRAVLAPTPAAASWACRPQLLELPLTSPPPALLPLSRSTLFLSTPSAPLFSPPFPVPFRLLFLSFSGR